MTTEIAIVNKHGIALAADSAVSITSYGNTDKIYNTANKLFMLSKHHPVAIMVYGGGSLIGVPWEPLIKEYRKSLNEKFFITLTEYAENFWEFIRTHDAFFPLQEQEIHLKQKIETSILRIRTRLISELENSSDTLASLSDKDKESHVADTLRMIINLRYRDLLDQGYLDGFSAEDEDYFHENYDQFSLEVAKTKLENTFDYLEDEDRNILLKSIAMGMSRDDFDHYSGIVIAGYGNDDIYPQVASYRVGVFFNKKPRVSFAQNLSSVNRDQFTASIIPFAQDDDIRTFLTGIDPAINSLIYNVISQLGASLTETIPAESLNPALPEIEIRQNIKASIDEYMRNALQMLEKEQQELVLGPILNMLEFMPKDELAEMAETLVNLTAFKRRMSPTPESVGGPVDVAVLSKGDGFIWVKRKHYFTPELNQHFFANYYK